MLNRLGAKIISTTVNYPNWGQIVVAFSRGDGKPLDIAKPRYTFDEICASKKRFHSSLEMFQAESALVQEHKKGYGFGAAQISRSWITSRAVSRTSNHPGRITRCGKIPLPETALYHRKAHGAVRALRSGDYRPRLGRALVKRTTELGSSRSSCRSASSEVHHRYANRRRNVFYGGRLVG